MSQRRHTADIARRAARLIVEDGLDWGAARRQALHQSDTLSTPGRAALPDNDQLEAAVREHIAIFCPETQAQQLHALRALALQWMERLAAFDPQLTGAVWRGTATHRSDIHLHLFCADPKEPEIALINANVRYHGGSTRTPDGREVATLALMAHCAALQQPVGIHLLILDPLARRVSARPGAPDGSQRGDARALRRLMAEPATAPHAKTC